MSDIFPKPSQLGRPPFPNGRLRRDGEQASVSLCWLRCQDLVHRRAHAQPAQGPPRPARLRRTRRRGSRCSSAREDGRRPHRRDGVGLSARRARRRRSVFRRHQRRPSRRGHVGARLPVAGMPSDALLHGCHAARVSPSVPTESASPSRTSRSGFDVHRRDSREPDGQRRAR